MTDAEKLRALARFIENKNPGELGVSEIAWDVCRIANKLEKIDREPQPDVRRSVRQAWEAKIEEVNGQI